MFKTDRFRLRVLDQLKGASRPVLLVDVEKRANKGLQLADVSRLRIIRDMRRMGWIERTRDEKVLITREGRIARAALVKAFCWTGL